MSVIGSLKALEVIGFGIYVVVFFLASHLSVKITDHDIRARYVSVCIIAAYLAGVLVGAAK